MILFFWIREIGGWALILIALYLIWIGLGFISNMQSPKIFEAAVIMLTGLGILRAGILLIRLSTASRLSK